ncbi:MAG: TrkA family potassium uptake protein [Candidatus Omnitrophica bacterium]|nr:TrkA family potassium uptake protein [Candidatus Omnitrophota bacterium]
MKKYAIIGLGRFGASVARTLAEKGQQVLAVDKREDLVQDIMDVVTKAVCLDVTDEKAVKKIGLSDVDVAVCGIGTDLEASILITLMLKDLNVPVIIGKADSLAHQRVLQQIGATKVILPEKDTGVRLAEQLISVSDQVLDHIGLDNRSSIIEFLAPEKFEGKTLRDLAIRAKYGVNVIAIKNKEKKNTSEEEKSTRVTPKAEDVIRKGDILVVFGENHNLEQLKKEGE